MAMANSPHVFVEKEVIQSTIEDLLNTKLQTRNFMKVDRTLADNVGLTLKINQYTYDGNVEVLGNRQGNSTLGKLAYTPVEYTVARTQGAFDFSDLEVMSGGDEIIDYQMKSQSTLMVNDINERFFGELAKATLTHNFTTKMTYEDVVDAIAKLNTEDESGLNLFINPQMKAQLRKDPNFMNAQLGEILFSGYIGTISGVRVVESLLVPADTAYLATADAVSLFVKKEVEVGTERDENTTVNTVYMRYYNVCALTQMNKAVKIVKA